MAAIIYTNQPSLVAQNFLTTNNNALSKSIQRLSSGLRINSAADDASGLAISEKLRGQIRGLSKASMNAQDAVSYLQTAEGGMSVIGDMIQRMRELAVQAGNGIYTSSDRAELQKEVDQLKEEINRISTSTEFNTKKLLSGQAAALWSTNSTDVEAIVRGAPAEGNYRLDISVNGGKNAVYKSDIMTVNKDLTMIGANTTAINALDASGNLKMLNGATINVQAAANTTVGAGTAIAAFKGPASSTSISSLTTVTSTTGFSANGYVSVEYQQDTTIAAAGDTIKAIVTFTDAATGATTSQEVDIVSGTPANVVVSAGTLQIDAGVGTYSAGDKVLFGVQGAVTAGANDALISIGNVNTTNGAGPNVLIADGQKGGSFTVVGLSATGELTTSTIDYTVDSSQTWAPGTLTINALSKGDVATTGVKLKDIGLFTNADGRMILDNTQELTIYGGNGTSATIYVEGNDTIQDFADKLANAIANELGMGSDTISTSDLVQFIADGAQTSNNAAVPGTFVIQTALMGSASELKFSGDENLINALSLTTIQNAKEADMTVTVYDAHTGSKVGSDTVSDGILRGVIKGIDVKINTAAGVTANFDANTMSMTFNKNAQNAVAYLHVVNNRTEAQIGASEGQTFDISIGEMNTTSLEIDNAFVTSFDDAQKAITKFDQALTKVTSARATIGAQINRLEYAMQNISTTKENLTAAESRIRDLDIAAESATYARNQILVQSATAMVAQANQLPQTFLSLIS